MIAISGHQGSQTCHVPIAQLSLKRLLYIRAGDRLKLNALKLTQ
nr:hypothetical protein [Roseofilum reptotaenium]